ncbi:MAG: glycosyltransferase [Amaricoccus sp.]
MLICETGGSAPQDYEDLAAFASQLAALGHPVGVPASALPDGLTRNAQFDLAPYLVDAPGLGDRLILIAAQRLEEARLARLRRLAADGPRACLAFGSFGSRQAMIGAGAKLAYVCGAEPVLVDLTAPPGAAPTHADAPVFGIARRAAPAAPPRLLLVEPNLAEPGLAADLGALALSRLFSTTVLTDGRSKQDWRAARGSAIPFHQYGEMLPAPLAELSDLCVCFTPIQRNYRLHSLIANLAASGVALIDATRDHGIAAENDAFIPGPSSLRGLPEFLGAQILPNLASIAAHLGQADFTARIAPARLLEALAPPPRRRRAPARRPDIVFMPTNGVGLGHAQRCSLIAGELAPRRASPAFAAFPSCLALVKSRGFDAMPLIGRSPLHQQSHENDLATYLRLRALTETASALVFDGGYIFDSVCRCIAENRLKGIWIRRGLWQAGQDASVALDREKLFGRVIVPGEAFDELNERYSHGTQLREVGPIVQRVTLDPAARAALRAGLAERFGIGFERLVVSQLGAGVAGDRAAEIQALCGLLERQPDILHLVLVWPSSVLQPAWFGWRRSRVVRSLHAATLAAAADLAISAAGYNSFHEALYNQTPTIFVPQTGAFMDDQHRRARAARERGLALLVEASDLMQLEREVGRLLQGGEAEMLRQRLASADLPEPGTARAARLIEEFVDGPADAVDRHSAPDRQSRRR